MEILREIMKRRILTPNNATTKFQEYLSSKGFKVLSDKRRRKYLEYNNKKYCITITSSDSDKIICRQFSEDGVISLYEKTGQIYFLQKDELFISEVTREMYNESYKNAESIFEIEELDTFDKIKQVDINEYKRNFIDIADLVGKEILANTYMKLK